MAERFQLVAAPAASRRATRSAMLVVLLGPLGMLVELCCWTRGIPVGR